MNCLQSATASSGRAAQCDSGSTTNVLEDDDDFGAHCSRPPKYIGAPLIMEAASKVDKCLARLHTLQGTVAVPKVHVSTTSSASTLSPIFSRSRSCLHGSPRVHENEKIRIHDVLRWSDDFSGKFKQERRDKYMRRLSRSKTEVFDDKKDPLDPHGEWKHWSSPAGDVHKVISEILMASQIARQITSMVSAAIVQSDNSSDEGKRTRRPTRDTATSPNPISNPGLHEKRRKGDPLHKFRVVPSADGPATKRSSTCNRKEVLYPKSKQPIPDRSRHAGEIEVTLSTAKKMQSRRSPRVAVKETRPKEEMWSAKDITNSKLQQPQPEMRAAKGVTSSKSQQSQVEMRAAKGVNHSKSRHLQADTWLGMDATNSKLYQSQANMRVAKDISDNKPHQSDQGEGKVITNIKCYQSQGDMWAASDVTNARSLQSRAETRAAKDTARSESQELQGHMWAAKEITNGKSHQPQLDVCAAKDVTNRKSQRRAAPWPESKKLAPVNEMQESYTVRRVRSSRSPPRTLVEKPKLSTTSRKSVKPSFIVKQGNRGPQHVRMEPWGSTSSTTTAQATEPSVSNIMFNRHLSDDSLPVTDSPLSSAAISEVKLCNPSPSALPVYLSVLRSRASSSGDAKETTATSATSCEMKMYNLSGEEFLEPAADGFAVLRSTVPESITCSGPSSPQLRSPAEGTYQPVRDPLIGSLRHKFVLEATEIKGPSKSWRLTHAKSSKAVLFSNPAFAPASPNGARPVPEIQQQSDAATPPKSPVRSISATRRVLDRIGRAISVGRRSMSPEITRRLNATRQKLMFLSPGKSLPSLISRLPSRGRRKPSPVPRATIVRSTSCARPAPISGELPLPPGRKPLGAAAQQKARRGADHGPRSPVADSTDSSSYFSLRMLKDLNCNAAQIPVKKSSKGTTPDIAPRPSISKDSCKLIKCHANKDWEKEMGVVSVLSSCRKWVEQSAPPLPGGVCRHEKENVEPAPQRILINDNVVATGWDDEAVAPTVLSTSRSRKVGDNTVLPSAGSSYTSPRELNRSVSGVSRSFSTGRLRTGGSLLKRARDWMRTQTPTRAGTHSPNWDQPRQSGLIL